MTTTDDKVLYTVAEAAKMLSIPERSVWQLHKEGRIAFSRVTARKTRVHADEIRKFAASLETF